MSEKKDLKGKRFSRLVVIREAEKRKGGQVYWCCQCDCGEEVNVLGSNLRRGMIRSCGCLRKEMNFKHGQTNGKGNPTSIYSIWNRMISRCSNPKDKKYNNYGGRGIIVCERWKQFTNFYYDMGDKPKNKSLDRIDNDGHYTPTNCRWATKKEQQDNRRVRGYYWDKRLKRWRIQVTTNYKQIYIGLADTEGEARQIYLDAKRWLGR